MATFSEIIKGEKPVLVDFYATWCGPCKTMSPMLDQLKREVGASATVLKIDVDKNQSAAAAYAVQGVPTLILFKNGKIVWRQSGIVPITQLQQLIMQHA